MLEALWSEEVIELRDFPTIDTEVKNILKVAREVAEEGFSDMIKDNVEERIEEYRGTLSNEELKYLLKPSADDDDYDSEDLGEAGPSMWTLEKFSAVFK